MATDPRLHPGWSEAEQRILEPKKAQPMTIPSDSKALVEALERIRDQDQARTPPYNLGRFGTIAQAALASISSREENGFKHPDGFRSELPAPATQAEREAVARIILGPKSNWNTHHSPDDSLQNWTHYPHIENALAKADAILSLLESRRTTPDPRPLTALLTRWDNGESVGDLITQYLRGEGDWGPVRVLVGSLGSVACSAEPSLASRVSDNGPATPSGGE